MTSFTESVVEEAAPARLEASARRVVRGPEPARGQPFTERRDHRVRILVCQSGRERC